MDDLHGIRLVEGDAHDEALVARVRPPGWQAPEPAARYDLVVVGAGTAGLVCAAGAAGLGARVALVERALMGGDCLVTGCVPSKALLRAAKAVHAAGDAHALGLGPATARVDGEAAFAAAMERLRRLRAEIASHDSASRFQSLGVDVFLGEARFVAPDAVEVDGKRLRFSRAVVATGARAAVPEVPGLREAGCLTNESVFALTALPRRLAILGAGPIGCEMAQAFRRFGSEVTVASHGSRVLPKDELDAARIVEARLAREGVVFRFGAKLSRVERTAAGKRLVLEDGGEVVADEILVAVGRAPNVEGLGLEAAGVEFDARRGVHVDDRLRTTSRRIFAAGDACSAFKFTHAAEAMARIVIQNALFRLRARVSSLVIPWCTFTDPEVAHVGMTEAEAAGRDDVRTFTVPLAGVDRAVLESDEEGFARVRVSSRGRILGATLVAAHAGESIAEVALAMAHGLPIGALERTIHPYPTEADALRRCASAWQKSRLSPAVARVLRAWMTLTR